MAHTPKSHPSEPGSPGDGPDLRILIGGGIAILVVVAAVGYFFLFRKTGTVIPTENSISASVAVAGCEFKDAKELTLTVDPKADRKKADKAAGDVASAVGSQLNTLYGHGFCDPSNWQKGTYDNAVTDSVFDTGALTEAKGQLDVLTAGANAGVTFSSIAQGGGKLRVQVLLDKNYKPASASGSVTFTATATTKDGSSVTLQSEGQFIFANVDGTWKIVSFNVTRDDKSGEAVSTTSSSTP